MGLKRLEDSQFLRGALLVLLVWLYGGPSSASSIDIQREPYIESVYASLPQMLHFIGTSKNIGPDEMNIDYLDRIRALLNSSNPPKLVFVDNPSQFIIPPEQIPKAMRSPSDPSGPIFVNRQLINSSEFQLDLPEVIKLLLHELGHKAGIESLSERDHYAQQVKDILAPFYTRSEIEKDGSFVEFIGISPDHIEKALFKDRFRVQRTFVAYHHGPKKVTDLSSALELGINQNALILKSLQSEVSAAITEIGEVFGSVAGDFFNLGGAIAGAFVEVLTGKQPDLEKVKPFEGGLTAMILFEPKSASSFKRQISFIGRIHLLRSHQRSMRFKVTGLPFEEDEVVPVEVKIFGDKVEVSPIPEPKYETVAIGRNIIREGSELRALDVEFQPGKRDPYTVELGLEAPTQTIRIPAKEIRPSKDGKFMAHFEMDSEMAPHFTHIDKLFINGHKTLLLKNKVEIGSQVASPLPHLLDLRTI